MNNYVTSLLRTYVPLAWGSALAWLVGAGVLADVEALDAAPFGPVVLVPIATGAYYALVRLLERQTWWPVWASRVLLGAAAAPAYGGRADYSNHVADIISNSWGENRPLTPGEAQELVRVAGTGRV